MIRSTEKKNNFFYFWLEKFLFIFWDMEKPLSSKNFFIYILGTWDLFILCPPSLLESKVD